MPTALTGPEERTHALYAPSAAERWHECAYSIIANAGGGVSSVYAEEGTAGHELLDSCLMLDVSPYSYMGKLIYKSYPVTEDMADAVAQAIDWINGYMVSRPHAVLHRDLNVDPYKWLKCEPGKTSGTLDVAISNALEELVIIDYKHGVNVGVDVVGNKQLLHYAFGYYVQYCTRPFKRYRLVVIQPRHRHIDGPVREYVITHEELMAYGASLKKRIAQIEKDPQARKAGDHCTFCAAAGSCKTLLADSLAMAKLEFDDMPKDKPPMPADPKTMKPEEIFYIALHKGRFEKWLHAIDAQAMVLLLKGQKSKQVKLVDGQTHRVIKESKEDALQQTLVKQLKFKVDEVAPRKLVGIVAMEELFRTRIRKATGKARIPAGKADNLLPPVVNRYIGKSNPPLHIAPIDDPRPAKKRGSEFDAVPFTKEK